VRISSPRGHHGLESKSGKDVKINLPPKLSFGGAMPSATSAFAAGFTGGLEGGALWDSENIGAIVSASTASLEKRTKTISGSKAGGAVPAGKAGRVLQAMRRRADAIDAKHYPYSSPGNRGFGIGGPMDCSGAVSKVVGPSLLDSVHDSVYFKGWGEAGHGRHITTFSRGGTGASGHVFMSIDGKGFGTSTENPGGGAGWLSYNSRPGFIARHPKGLRKGGIAGADLMRVLPRRFRKPSVIAEIQRHGVMPGLRLGGVVAARRHRTASPVTGVELGLMQLPTASHGVRDVLRQFALAIDTLDATTAQILRQRLADLRATAHHIRRGGVHRGERTHLRAIEREAGNVRGQLRARAPSYRGLERMEGQLAGRIRAIRRGGVSDRERVQVQRLTGAMRIVETEMGRRTGRLVQIVDKQRDAIERSRTRMEQRLRRSGVDQASAAGLAEMQKFTVTQGESLKKQQQTLRRALTRAQRRGDRNAIKEITDRLNQVKDDIQETFTSWVEQARQQVQAAAQERVDIAGLGSTFAQHQLEMLSLHQQLTGTFETGGAQRAQAIREQEIPAFERELDALRSQFQAAQQTGDPALARQIAEAIWGKEQDIEQAKLDAMQAVEANTDNLKEFAGSLAFSRGDSIFTDRELIALPAGA
jgi:hypothetical protein